MTLRRAENISLSYRPRWLASSPGDVTVLVGKQRYLWRGPTKEQWRERLQLQLSQPVLILSTEGRNLWHFQNRFYWDTDELDQDAVYALLVTRAQRDRQRIDRAKAMVAMGTGPRQAVRGAIPDDVKQLVWQRDGGRCRQCGSVTELQFDHVIPAVMGGASTVENLQGAV